MIKIPVDRFINYQSINRKNQTYEMIITNFNLNQKTASKNKKFIIFIFEGVKVGQTITGVFMARPWWIRF
ncbi:MAG: hypothetical protein Q8731_02535 [Candidatus Phytoplasma australasiaticum]|nr:hypothetical protein [Candidatus Phytoplasma australasiaticum]